MNKKYEAIVKRLGWALGVSLHRYDDGFVGPPTPPELVSPSPEQELTAQNLGFIRYAEFIHNHKPLCAEPWLFNGVTAIPLVKGAVGDTPTAKPVINEAVHLDGVDLDRLWAYDGPIYSGIMKNVCTELTRFMGANLTQFCVPNGYYDSLIIDLRNTPEDMILGGRILRGGVERMFSSEILKNDICSDAPLEIKIQAQCIQQMLTLGLLMFYVIFWQFYKMRGYNRGPGLLNNVTEYERRWRNDVLKCMAKYQKDHQLGEIT